MVLYIVKWDIHPDKADAYIEWTKSAIPRVMSVPGVVEFRAYRAAGGAPQVVATYEFPDMAAWAAWWSHPDCQEVMNELHALALNVTTELWGPSPLVPKPIQPG